MQAFVEGVRSGAIAGSTGRPLRSVLHIGIGGSDLGPRLVWEALKPLDPRIELRFAANVDGSEIAAALQGLHPAGDAGGGGLEDLHHPGDHGQRRGRPRLAARRSGRRGRRAPGCGQRRAGGGAKVRGGGGAGVRLPRLGGRAVLRLVGGGAVLRGGPRLGGLERLPAGRGGHGRPFPRGPSAGQRPGAHGAGPGLQSKRTGAGHPGRRSPTPSGCACCPPSSSSWRWSPTASG
jgi:hypothetical protein